MKNSEETERGNGVAVLTTNGGFVSNSMTAMHPMSKMNLQTHDDLIIAEEKFSERLEKEVLSA